MACSRINAVLTRPALGSLRNGRGGCLKQFLSLQYLRAAAALGVVVFHFTHQAFSPDAARLFERGQFGVDLFFVLSGCIMWTSTAERETTPASFLARRIARVVPLYWLATIGAAVVTTEPAFRFGLAVDPATLASSLLFIPDWSPKADGVVAPILAVGWTLNLEMAFYALFAAGLLLRPALRLPAIGGCLVAASILGLFVETRSPAIEAYTNSAVVEFAFGMALGRFYQIGALRGEGGGALIAAGVALALLAPFDLDWRGFTFGPAAAAIVAGFILLEERLAAKPARTASSLGDASYSLYLTHTMALAVMTFAIGRFGVAGDGAILVAIEVIVASLAAVMVYRLIERPLTRFAQSAVKNGPARGRIAAATG